jgi:predicted HTH transcriptional regulator
VSRKLHLSRRYLPPESSFAEYKGAASNHGLEFDWGCKDAKKVFVGKDRNFGSLICGFLNGNEDFCHIILGVNDKGILHGIAVDLPQNQPEEFETLRNKLYDDLNKLLVPELLKISPKCTAYIKDVCVPLYAENNNGNKIYFAYYVFICKPRDEQGTIFYYNDGKVNQVYERIGTSTRNILQFRSKIELK